MGEFTMLRSMLNILNSNNKKKKAVIESLLILLDTYDIYGEFDLFSLIVTSTHNLCFDIFNPQCENSIWKDSDVSLDNLKSLLIYFIDIIEKHSREDIIKLFQHCIELTNKIDFKNCSHQQISNIGFCMQKLYSIVYTIEKGDCTHLNHLRNTLINVLNEPFLNKNKLDAVLMFLSNIVSINYMPTLWEKTKSLIKTHPNRLISLLFNLQCLLFDCLCVDVILNDDDFWNLLCNLLNCENNLIRTYNNVILKLSCSQLLNENINYCPSKNREQCVKLWNDYVVVMETLENSQQHLTLPILSTATSLVSKKNKDDSDDYKLPLEWITAMYYKMSKHSSKYVVLASIDIITNMPIVSLKKNKLLLQSFLDSLNNVFLYKMSSEINVEQPQLELILTLWFNKLLMSNDGHDIFCIFLSYIPTIKWTIVPLIFLTKSLSDISLNSPFGFNIVKYVLNIKSAIDEMPKSYLKTVVLSFLFIFNSKFFAEINTEFNCDLFDCIIMIHHENTKSWNYLTNSVKKVNDLDHLDKQLTQHIIENNKMYSTSIGLLILSNICVAHPVSIKMLDKTCSNTIDLLDRLHFLEHLLQVESHFGRSNTYVSEILDKHIWPLTTIWVEKCLENKKEYACEDSVICSFLDKVLSSNRIINTNKIINNWLIKCKASMEHKGNYYVLAVYSWIGKYATRTSTEHKLKIDWMSFTKYFIKSGYFSLRNQGFYHSRKPGLHKIPLLDIIDTFFQYSTVNSVSEEEMLDIFAWLTEKTVERHDNYWSIYFSTVKTFLCKFPIQVNSQKIIQFVKNCWEFLVNCRISCFPKAIKSFIEMAFHHSLLSEETYVTFLKNEIIQNILTQKYRDTFNVCFSLLLLNFFKKDQLNVITILESYQIISEFFAKCLLFSIDRYGAVKIEWDTFEYIQTLGDLPLINNISFECLANDRYLRFSTIKFVYKLNSNILWKNILNLIVKTESSLRDRKFFHNSKAHRIKQRVVQVLLIVACDKNHEPLIFEENIYKWLLSSLKEVSHIHSVAYQLIWLLVIIYTKYLSFSDFCNDFKNAKDNHNYLCSFISIIYHQLRLKNKKEFEIEAKKLLLPLCFSNGYKIRLYAQTTICKLFSDSSEETKWPLLCEAISNIISENEQTKKYENPFHDFFYQNLDMFNSLSLKNVCIEVPRLLNIIYEERFPVNWFNDFSENMNNNDKYDLSSCSVSSFIKKSTTSVLSNAMNVIDNPQNTQRKYVPSQPMSERVPNSMLIVVASLIDKVTNLGGLARTCQVFGASTLVVDHLSCTEKREFTALSMSAEKHQYIIEVKIKNLKSYLQKKKNEGYQIVAAEQTVDSVKLHGINLPFKCVLLLGNETSGIPHDLLSIMDTCVEIEQLGIVRSLNVHVAGSLFIWEYTKQHCIKMSN
ncbi:Alpha/beta knot methyltransferases,tRNA/rRNA methyltransferase, SpoU type,Armadillo-like helical,tRNA [Cinara cedri]|uniref:Alpha/beta knot methyltransferases,tRNA/rRNA methyltransferase, SpoU type,Armadillo-like helical,tRNA n=1 Tax=Cinara cedri TaxID=506608 RepID=A0A5E4NRK3_9HEMI|nr:Alpha/beta knot methyltransferases,tRNA/rRNA methyltransferase, SpoU type,Armadillo-like helical,tRNA [Cinara cedri]